MVRQYFGPTLCMCTTEFKTVLLLSELLIFLFTCICIFYYSSKPFSIYIAFCIDHVMSFLILRGEESENAVGDVRCWRLSGKKTEETAQN